MTRPGRCNEQSLAGARAVLGADNPNALPFVNQVAVFYRESGHLDRAEPLAREALARRSRRRSARTTRSRRRACTISPISSRPRAGRPRRSRSTAAHSPSARRRWGRATPRPRSPILRSRAASDRTRARQRRGGRAGLRRAGVLSTARAYPEARIDVADLASTLAERAGKPAQALAELEGCSTCSTRCAPSAASRTRRAPAMSRAGSRSTTACSRSEAPVGEHRRRVRGPRAHRARRGAARTHRRRRRRSAPRHPEPVARHARPARAPCEIALTRAQSALGEAQGRTDLKEADRLELIAALEGTRDSLAAELDLGAGRHQGCEPGVARGADLERPARIARRRPARGRAARRTAPRLPRRRAGCAVFVVPSQGTVTVEHLEADRPAAATLGIPAGPLKGSDLRAILEGGRTSAGGRIRIGLADWLSGRRRDPLSLASSEALESRLGGGAPLTRCGGCSCRRARGWHCMRRASPRSLSTGHSTACRSTRVTVAPSPDGGTTFWLDDGPAPRYASSATSMLSLVRRDATRAGPTPKAARVACLSVSDPAFAKCCAGIGGFAERNARQSHMGATPGHGARVAGDPQGVRARQRRRALRRRRDRRPRRSRARGPPRSNIPPLRHPRVRHRAPQRRARGSRAHAVPRRGSDRLRRRAAQIYEIYELPLAYRLAVLSACETERGPRVEGEGVFCAVARVSRRRGQARDRFAVAGPGRVHRVARRRHVQAARCGAGESAGRHRGGRAARRQARAARPGAVARSVLLGPVHAHRRAVRRASDREGAVNSPLHWAPFTLTGAP